MKRRRQRGKLMIAFRAKTGAGLVADGSSSPMTLAEVNKLYPEGAYAESSVTYTVEVETDPKVIELFDSTGDGVVDSGLLDTNGDGSGDAVGKIVDTTGDGVGDSVQADTTGDGLLDALVGLDLGQPGSGSTPIAVVPESETKLKLKVRKLEGITFENMVEGIESWGDFMLHVQAEQLNAVFSDFTIERITVGLECAQRGEETEDGPGQWQSTISDLQSAIENAGNSFTIHAKSQIVTKPATTGCCTIL